MDGIRVVKNSHKAARNLSHTMYDRENELERVGQAEQLKQQHRQWRK